MRPIYFAEYRGEGHMFTRPDPFKAEILAYFEGIEPAAVAAGYFTDEITGEQVTDRAELGYIDGGWTWTAGDVYHFERYDLELSHEFREHATGRLIIDDTAGEATRSPIRGSAISIGEFLDGFPHDEHGNALMQDPDPHELQTGPIDPTIAAITEEFRRRKHGPNGAGE